MLFRPHMKSIFIAAAGCLAAIGFTVTSCSFPNSNSVGGYFIADKGLPRTVGPGRAQIVGYVVNVSGPGISPTVSAESIGDYAPDCVDVGVSSLVVSYETLTEKGVRLRIPGGPNRKIEVLGVQSSLGSVALNQPVTALFKNRVPELFSLAKLSGVNLFKDSTIELTGPANPVNPTNILENCFAASGGSSGGELNLADISALKVIALSGPSPSSIQTINLDKDTGVLSGPVNTATLLNTFDELALSSDKTTVLIWNKATGVNGSFFMDSVGELSSKGGGATARFFSVSSFSTIFNNTGEFGLSGTVGIINFLKRSAGKYDSNPPGQILIKSTTQLLALGGYFYRVSNGGSGLEIDYAPFPPNGIFTDDLAFIQTGTIADATVASPLAASVMTSKGLYLLYTYLTTVKLAFLAVGPSGQLTQQGISRTVGPASNSSTVRIVVTPNRKYLFVYVDIGGFMDISRLDLSESGELPPVSSSVLTPTKFKGFAVDPFSRGLLVLESDNSSSILSNYPIRDDGRLGTPSVLSGSLSPNLNQIAIVPVK